MSAKGLRLQRDLDAKPKQRLHLPPIPSVAQDAWRLRNSVWQPTQIVSCCGLQTVLAEIFQTSLRYSACLESDASKPQSAVTWKKVEHAVSQNLERQECRRGEVLYDAGDEALGFLRKRDGKRVGAADDLAEFALEAEIAFVLPDLVG
jgi:hypothetical protein